MGLHFRNLEFAHLMVKQCNAEDIMSQALRKAVLMKILIMFM